MGRGDRNVNIFIRGHDKASAALRKVRGSVVAVGAAVAGITAVLAKATKAAAVQQQAEAELAAAFKDSGFAVEENIKRAKEYASALQSQSVYGDEAILGAQKLLVRLGKLSGDGLDRATKAAVDLAAATGQDLRSAFRLVAQAAGGNVSVLTRYIGKIKLSGDATTDFNRALERIEGTMGGAAAAEAGGAIGAAKQLSNAIGDIWEAVGRPFVSTEFVDFIKEITPLAAQAASDIASLADGITGLIRVGAAGDKAAELMSFARQSGTAGLTTSRTERYNPGGSFKGSLSRTVTVDTAEAGILRNKIESILLYAKSVGELDNAYQQIESLIRQGLSADALIDALDSVNASVVEATTKAKDHKKAIEGQTQALLDQKRVVERIATGDGYGGQLVPLYPYGRPAGRDYYQDTTGGGAFIDPENFRMTEKQAAEMAASINADLKQMGSTAGGVATQMGSMMTGALMQAMFAAQDLNNVLKSLVQTMISAGLSFALNAIASGGFGAATGGGGGFFGGFMNAGRVAHGAAGLLVPGRDTTADVVPALLAPGERVLSRAENERYMSGHGGGASISVGISARTRPQDQLRDLKRLAKRRGWAWSESRG